MPGERAALAAGCPDVPLPQSQLCLVIFFLTLCATDRCAQSQGRTGFFRERERDIRQPSDRRRGQLRAEDGFELWWAGISRSTIRRACLRPANLIALRLATQPVTCSLPRGGASCAALFNLTNVRIQSVWLWAAYRGVLLSVGRLGTRVISNYSAWARVVKPATEVPWLAAQGWQADAFSTLTLHGLGVPCGRNKRRIKCTVVDCPWKHAAMGHIEMESPRWESGPNRIFLLGSAGGGAGGGTFQVFRCT